MIDVETQIFDKVYNAVIAVYPNADVVSETVLAPSAFPCVSLEEADNYSKRNTRDSGSNENHVDVMYELNVYTNKTVGKKAECKAIFALVDNTLLSLGFTRTSKTPVSMDDSTKYRLTGRYIATVSKNEIIYRR